MLKKKSSLSEHRELHHPKYRYESCSKLSNIFLYFIPFNMTEMSFGLIESLKPV